MLVEEFGLIKIFVKENNWTGNQKAETLEISELKYLHISLPRSKVNHMLCWQNFL